MFIVGITATVYAPVSNFDFVNFDDSDYIYENSFVKSGLNLESIAWAFRSFEVANWHPLTWLSHMADSHFWGLDAGKHHLTSLVWHIINSILVFVLFRKTTGGVWQSGFVAALFALHPLHVESVAWISERKDLLSTFFGLLAILSYSTYVKHRSFPRYMLVVLLFVLSLMSKPMLVTLPIILLLIDYWPLGRFRTTPESDFYDRNFKPNITLVVEKIPLFIFTLASSLVTYFAQHSGGTVRDFEQVSILSRVANANVSYAAYIYKMIWPVDLAIFYPHPITFSLWEVGGSVILLLLITVASLVLAKDLPFLFVGWFWYIFTLIPVIGIIQVGMQAMADRYTYIPLLGIFIIVAWGVSYLVVFKWLIDKKIVIFLSVCVIALYAFVTKQQLRHWQDGFALSSRAVEVTAGNYLMENNLANMLVRRGEWGKAVTHYIEALRHRPYDSLAYDNLKKVLIGLKPDKSAAESMKGLASLMPENATAHYLAGKMLKDEGRLEQSIEYLERSVKLDPQLIAAYDSLSTSLMLNKQLDESLDVLEKQLGLEPDDSEVYFRIARIYELKQNSEKALEWYRIAQEKGYSMKRGANSATR